MKGLNIHVGKQHKIGDHLDGADDNDFNEDKGVQTEDPLLIFLQGEVAEDPDDELGPVGEKYWHLPKVFYFDKNTRSLTQAPHGSWVNQYGKIKDIKTGEVKGNISV